MPVKRTRKKLSAAAKKAYDKIHSPTGSSPSDTKKAIKKAKKSKKVKIPKVVPMKYVKKKTAKKKSAPGSMSDNATKRVKKRQAMLKDASKY